MGPATVRFRLGAARHLMFADYERYVPYRKLV